MNGFPSRVPSILSSLKPSRTMSPVFQHSQHNPFDFNLLTAMLSKVKKHSHIEIQKPIIADFQLQRQNSFSVTDFNTCDDFQQLPETIGAMSKIRLGMKDIKEQFNRIDSLKHHASVLQENLVILRTNLYQIADFAQQKKKKNSKHE
ncbi:hypothetical protein SS50377_22553 [Spironucleus salmonicida]|uniref:Uncharacterized protein n=1 Tax=Spironucleus salmonicida TaxID=348837 RepID=A0A9P8RZF4_9EUKA|nr:hypothetical protein SS50377_22553 [Spironucleus salmonicida]